MPADAARAKATRESTQRPAPGQENKQLVERIKDIHQQSRQTYGSPRVHDELGDLGVNCSENRVARLMRQHGIAAEKKRKFTRTTDSNHQLPIAPNRLNQHFEAEKPDRVWTADITYIWTKQGWLYLAIVPRGVRWTYFRVGLWGGQWLQA